MCHHLKMFVLTPRLRIEFAVDEMTEKLRDLRALLKRTNVPLLSLRNHLGKEDSASGAASAVAVTGKHLQALLVDTADAHQSEYVSAANKRREFLTGFTGSNGTGAFI